MRSIRNVIIMAVLALSAMGAVEGDNLEQVQNRLSSRPLIRGEFVQLRRMAMFRTPLESKGQFVLSKAHGMLWRQVTPFPVVLVLTRDRFLQQYEGQAAQILEAGENPVMFHFSHLFMSLFQGDTTSLSEHFQVSFTQEVSGWQIELTPLGPPLKSVFEMIRIKGGEFVDVLTLTEVRGDVTEINFSRQQVEPNRLTPDEEHAFQF